MALNLTLEQVKTLLKKANQPIASEARTGNNLGTVLKLVNGCIVNCWDKGTVNCQGKNVEQVTAILSNENTSSISNRKVFVVYGHDTNARTQLEAMLRRWDLEPLILDQLISSGQTIIEKLEEYTQQASFGIVLATPDDIGFPKNDETKKQYRVRQNVVLELGMLLSRIGREKSQFCFRKPNLWKNHLTLMDLFTFHSKITLRKPSYPWPKKCKITDIRWI